MIEQWLTEERKEEIIKAKSQIAVAELVEIAGKANIIGCTIGDEAVLSLLIASMMEKLAETNGRTFAEMEERVRIAHSWSASHKVISDMVAQYEGGKKDE